MYKRKRWFWELIIKFAKLLFLLKNIQSGRSISFPQVFVFTLDLGVGVKFSENLNTMCCNK